MVGVILSLVFLTSGSAHGATMPHSATLGIRQGHLPTQLWKAFPLRQQSAQRVRHRQLGSPLPVLSEPERRGVHHNGLSLWIVVGLTAAAAAAAAGAAAVASARLKASGGVSRSLGIERFDAVWFGLTVAASLAIGWFIGHVG